MLGSQITPFKKGSSTEFVDYRLYTPGDDPRRVDWKVYGRKDRFYLRSYEGECNATLWVVLDASRSMNFRGPGRDDKWSFSCRAALGLIYLALKNRDACGLALFADGLSEVIAPRLSWDVLSRAVSLLDGFSGFGDKTDYQKSFEQLTGELGRSQLVVVMSDFLGDSVAATAAALEGLSLARHEVIALRIIDPSEQDLSLDFSGMALVSPIERGQGGPLEIELSEFVQEYRRSWQQEESLLADRLARRSIEYCVFSTSAAPGELLADYLNRRSLSLKTFG